MPYGSNAEMDAYWVARGYVASGMDEAGKTAARTKASLYVDGLGYRDTGSGVRTSFWPGKPEVAGQLDAWPRSDATDIYGNELTGIPQRVINATYEAAFAGASGIDLNRSVAADQVVSRRKVDVIEVQYADPVLTGGSVDTRPMFPAVNDLLAPLIIGGSGNPYGITLVVG